ncbi:hypothetical protein VKT23_016560 [Stygiomarasmius scandens]|uniref:Myb/SANT-like domain-containing protein n=1 Tax=Marasmiellus scandens TaxID=2682957 RepID=A0ABR1IZ16_9AGAR
MAKAASWSDSDKKVLVTYLHGCRAQLGEGGNWTKTTLNNAVVHLAANTTPERGGPKTLGAIRTQWSALKKVYTSIREVVDGTAGSGLKYTNDKGFDIHDNTDQAEVWRGFVLSRSHLKPFRNAPWPLFDMMDDIMPTKATGLHVFNASQVASTPQAPTVTAPIPSVAHSEGSTVVTHTGEEEKDDSGVEDNDELQASNSPTTPAPKPLGKRTSAGDLETPNKRSKITGPEAIMSMSKSVASIGDALREAFGTRGEASPERKKKAQAQLREDESPELTRIQRTRLHILFTKDVTAADSYYNASDDMRLDVALELLGEPPL